VARLYGPGRQLQWGPAGGTAGKLDAAGHGAVTGFGRTEKEIRFFARRRAHKEGFSMSMRTGSIVSVLTLALASAAIGCSAGDPTTTRFNAGGSSGGSGSPGGAAANAGTGASGSAKGGQGGGGFDFPDSSLTGDASAAPTQTDAACAAEQRDSTPVKKDIIVLFDTSSSMACDVANATCKNAPPGGANTRIGAVRDAINAFVTAPASAEIHVGLGVFPGTPDQCTADYTQLTVPIAPAAGNAAPIGAALGILIPNQNTPTEQALTGTYTAAKAYIAANPGRSVAVVLVTDGMPFACGNDQTGAVSATLAKGAFDGTPSIETYVVGLGNVTTLDAIALAGTGGATHYIEANADATQKILDLLKLVSTMITCDYTIPTNGRTLDYKLVNVQAKVGDAGPMQKVYKVSNASGCAAARGGWYYDVDLPGTPTKITLCSETCEPLKAQPGSALQVLIGCATEPAIVN
jgi:Mg-chelatase subunit ChlD